MKQSRHFFFACVLEIETIQNEKKNKGALCDFRFSRALEYERIELINTWPRRYTCLRHDVDVIAYETEKFLNFLQDKNRSSFCI